MIDYIAFILWVLPILLIPLVISLYYSVSKLEQKIKGDLIKSMLHKRVRILHCINDSNTKGKTGYLRKDESCNFYVQLESPDDRWPLPIPVKITDVEQAGIDVVKTFKTTVDKLSDTQDQMIKECNKSLLCHNKSIKAIKKRVAILMAQAI